jgi:hypothetical protein
MMLSRNNRKGAFMTQPTAGPGSQRERVPLGQRLYDQPFLLLMAGIVVMVLFYTGWGLWEVLTLPPAPLP